jgi:hypothetical protein
VTPWFANSDITCDSNSSQLDGAGEGFSVQLSKVAVSSVRLFSLLKNDARAYGSNVLGLVTGRSSTLAVRAS